MASKRRSFLGSLVSGLMGHINPTISVKFNKEVDTGPQDYATMEPEMAKTIHEERIRRQVASRRYPPPKYSK